MLEVRGQTISYVLLIRCTTHISEPVKPIRNFPVKYESKEEFVTSEVHPCPAVSHFHNLFNFDTIRCIKSARAELVEFSSPLKNFVYVSCVFVSFLHKSKSCGRCTKNEKTCENKENENQKTANHPNSTSNSYTRVDNYARTYYCFTRITALQVQLL